MTRIKRHITAKTVTPILAFVLGTTMLWSSLTLVGAQQSGGSPAKPKYPDINSGVGRTRGSEDTDKLTPELRILYGQFNQARGGRPERMKFNADQLRNIFGIKDVGANPSVNVGIRLTSAGTIADLKKQGAKVYFRAGDLILARTSVLSLERLAKEHSVLSVTAAKAASVPPFPKSNRAPTFESLTRGGPPPAKLDNDFNSQTLTGKGVIIGVVDTGIDWKHPDFIKPDGSTRILYLWDMTDGSFEDSGGKIGTQPPVLEQGGDPGPGTVYTAAQINAALNGSGTVNSMDNFGHGTASAGTAAGNGRATANGVAPGTYKGVAPEADLIIVKAANCGGFADTYVLGTAWIAQLAKSRHQPVVINHSLGGHYTAHDGSEPEEQVMNYLTGTGKPGVAITISAGNEGQYSMHAGTRFGPYRQGQEDIDSSTIKVNVSAEDTWLNGYFNADEDWGLGLQSTGQSLVNDKGEPVTVFIYKIGHDLKMALPKDVKKPKDFDEFTQEIFKNTKLAKPGEKDQLWVPLKSGTYFLWGWGPTANVKQGDFDLYLPDYSDGGFVYGAQKKRMVGSPGNAANVVTVGSYDFRRDWDNREGKHTYYNLALGSISDYSSPGGPRADGGFKPEIVAPAHFTISSLSGAGIGTCEGNNMMSDAVSITRDGLHLAWAGTSAAAPFTAGVIALMLQKNPNLDGKQIKDILVKTATKGDRFVGGVPNSEWGYGKLNPSAAIIAVPPAGAPPRKRRGA